MLDFIDRSGTYVLPITVLLGAYYLGTGDAAHPITLGIGVVVCTVGIYLKLLTKS